MHKHHTFNIGERRKELFLKASEAPKGQVPEDSEIARLKLKYLDKDGKPTKLAIDEFSKVQLLKENKERAYQLPTITKTDELITNPDALIRLMNNTNPDLSKALGSNILTQNHLILMKEILMQREDGHRDVVSRSIIKQKEMQNEVEVELKKTFAENVGQNFNKMGPGMQALSVAAGLALLVKYFSWKPEKTSAKFTKYGLLPGLAFFAFGGSKLFEDTLPGYALSKIERGFNGAWDFGKRPDVKESDLELYSQFFTRALNVEVGKELEAMGYLSQVTVKSIAESFTYNGAGNAKFSIEEGSALQKEIEAYFGKNHPEVLSRIEGTKKSMADTLQHVFLIMGCKTTAEKTWYDLKINGKSYDSLSQDDKKMWDVIVNTGLKEAKNDTTNRTWSRFVGKNMIDIQERAGRKKPDEPEKPEKDQKGSKQ